MNLIKHLYQRGLVTLTLALGILILGTCVAIQPVIAHNAAILDCRENIVYTVADFLFGKSDGTFWTEGYDTSGDGKLDVLAMSHITGTTLVDGEVQLTHDPNPVFWMVDYELIETEGGVVFERRDGIPDTVYIDKNGLGVCTDIVIYDNLHNPASQGPHFDALPRAEI